MYDHDIGMSHDANAYEVPLPTIRNRAQPMGSAYAAPDVYDYATQGPNEEVQMILIHIVVRV